MLSRKQYLAAAALGLLVALSGASPVSAQDDQQQQKKRKDREISTQTGPAPVVTIADHARIITPCPDALAEAQIPLSVSVQNFSDPTVLRYNWRASGGRLVGDGPSATWDLSGAAPGTYQATIEVDNNRNDGCTAFTTTKVVVRECIRPPVCPNVSIYCPETVSVGAPVDLHGEPLAAAIPPPSRPSTTGPSPAARSSAGRARPPYRLTRPGSKPRPSRRTSRSRATTRVARRPAR